MNERDLLVLRRAGALWGVATGEVHRLTGEGTHVRVELAQVTLLADEIVGVAPALVVRPPTGVLHRFWREPCDGIAVHGAAPLVVVNGRHPPSSLLAMGGEDANGERTG